MIMDDNEPPRKDSAAVSSVDSCFHTAIPNDDLVEVSPAPLKRLNGAAAAGTRGRGSIKVQLVDVDREM
jgi:hypothetical protein